MMRSWKLAAILLAAMLGLTPSAWAQASALPDDAAKPGRFSIELGISSQGLQLKFGVQKNTPEPTPAIDVMCPNIVPAYVQGMWNRLKGAFGAEPSIQGANPELERDKQVTQLFEVGEIYRRTGHYTSARNYYQRAHLTAPTSRLGQLAIDRIGEMEDRLREAEESSETDPETLSNELRDRTIPLGLAQPVTY